MAVINYATGEISCKIVYYGPAMCGKTTNLQMIYGMVAKESRGELVSLATDQDRTLYFDFLPLDLGQIRGLTTKFQLYTVPGQVYYNATRKLVLRGADGLVFVADSSAPRMDENLESLQNLRENLAEYGQSLDDMPWIIQYNKRDLDDALPVDEMQAALNSTGVEHIEAVAASGQGIKETLKKISSLIIARLGTIEPEPARELMATPVAAAPSVASQPASPLPLSPKPGNGRTVSPVSQRAAETPAPRQLEFAVKQKSTVLWRGLRVGTASLEARNRTNADGRGAYQLAEMSQFFGMFRRVAVRTLDLAGEERREVCAQMIPGYRFHVREQSGDASGKQSVVWLSQGDHDILLQVDSRMGRLEYVPESWDNSR